VTYREVLERLFAARRFGVVLGLERIGGVLARLGDPQLRIGRVAHVGGTNGKGSTAAMIAAIGAAAGRRVAVYSSPHLSTMRERMVVGGEMISEDEVVGAARAVWDAGGDELTFFEQITAMALWWFAQRRPELTVLEVGLGGRLDATNIVDAEVAAVTGVAKDHEAVLGDTLEAIAGEKAGIFKAGRRAVIGCSGEASAVPYLVEGARQARVGRLTVVGESVLPEVALAGAHQRRNAACALAVIDHLEAIGALEAPAHVRATGLARVRHPGRLETIEGEVGGAAAIVVDGAHNPQGAVALADALEAMPRPRALVLAVSSDKDVAAMIAPLVPVADRVIATRYQQPRALDPGALADAARTAGMRDVEVAADLQAALAQAHGAATIVVAGSLFLVGEARTLLLNAPTDPFVVSDPAPARP
jgi:dihydrofolate synthase/folylpolyglutamate synthase